MSSIEDHPSVSTEFESSLRTVPVGPGAIHGAARDPSSSRGVCAREEEMAAMHLTKMMIGAARDGDVEGLRAYCSKNGACVDAKDSIGWGAIHRAAMNGRVECAFRGVGALRRCLAVVGRLDRTDGRANGTARSLARRRPSVRPSVRQRTPPGKGGEERRGRGGSLTQNRKVVRSWARVGLRVLVDEFGADVDARDDDGWTAAHRASWIGQLESLRCLRELGADLNAFCDAHGETAVHVAARNGRIAALRCLVTELGAAVDAADGYGRTAVHFAAFEGNVAVLRCLKLLGHLQGQAKEDLLLTSRDEGGSMPVRRPRREEKRREPKDPSVPSGGGASFTR